MNTYHGQENKRFQPMYRNWYIYPNCRKVALLCPVFPFSTLLYTSSAVRSLSLQGVLPSFPRPSPRPIPARSWSIYGLWRCYLETFSCAFPPGAFALWKGTLQTHWTPIYTWEEEGEFTKKKKKIAFEMIFRFPKIFRGNSKKFKSI